jgi:hypothetical protein
VSGVDPRWYDGVFDAVINLFSLFDTINPISLARVFRERDWHELGDGTRAILLARKA